MVTGHVFIATSLDGFIARPDGSLDWLISRDNPEEDHGYESFISGMDAILMGRGTFETARRFPEWPYSLPVLVLSTQLAGRPPEPGLQGQVTVLDLSPAAAMAELGRQGHRRVYVDGGRIVQSFLRAGLVHDLTITTAPVLIGQGRPLFGTLVEDVPLVHLQTRAFPSGLVQTRWRVA